MNNKDVIITGELDSSALEKSISELVKTVEQKTNQMAQSFDNAMQKMGNSMQGVAASNNAIIAGIEAEIAANNKLVESINNISNAEKERSSKKEKVLSKSEVFAMPDNTIHAIEAKLSALKKLQSNAVIGSRYFIDIKNEYDFLQGYKKEVLKSENEIAAAKRSKAEEEKQRIKEEQQLKREIAEEEKQKRKEQERINKEAAAAEKQRLKDIKREKEQIFADEKRETALKMGRISRMEEDSVDKITQKIESLQALQKKNLQMRALTGKDVLGISGLKKAEAEIDRLQKKIEKLNNSNLSPKNVFAMPEKTLNDISAKMKALSSLRANTNLNHTAEISRLNAEYERLNRAQRKVLNSGIQLEKHGSRLSKTIRNLGQRVLFYFALSKLRGFVNNLFMIRGEYEMLERSIGILVDNMKQGSDIFRTLQANAKKSPFTLIELGTAAKQLAAYDFQSNELVDTTRRLADISSALNVPIERLVYNLGQIKAQGVLNARDARDFANAGLAIVPMLSKMYSEIEGKYVSTAEVYDRMKKKMVSYKDVLSVINQTTDEGGKFYDFQAKQAETLKVKIMNLSLAYNDMMNDIGQSSQGFLGFLVDIPKKIFENWRGVLYTFIEIASVIGIYKAKQLVLNKVLDGGIGSIRREIMAEKRAIAAKLMKKKAIMGLTAEEETQLTATKNLTVADMASALAAKNVTKAEAARALIFRRLKMSMLQHLGIGKKIIAALSLEIEQIKKATMSMGLLSKAEIKAIFSGKALATTFNVLWASLKDIAKSIAAFVFNPTTMTFAALAAIASLIGSIIEANNKIKDFHNSLVDSAKESFEKIDEFIKKHNKEFTQEMQNTLNSGEKFSLMEDMNDAIKESSVDGQKLVDELLKIEDVNKRFDETKKVLQEISDAEYAISRGAANIDYSESKSIFGLNFGYSVPNLLELYNVMYNEGTKVFDEWVNNGQFEILTEYIEEIGNQVAESIHQEGIKSEAGITTLLSNVKEKFLETHQTVNGLAADFFNVNLETYTREALNENFGYKLDTTAALWENLMERLRHSSKGTIEQISLKQLEAAEKMEDLPPKVQQLIKEAGDQMMREIPNVSNTIKRMVNDLNRLKVLIPVHFSINGVGGKQTPLQQAFEGTLNRIPSPNTDYFIYKDFMPSSNDTPTSWSSKVVNAVNTAKKDLKNTQRMIDNGHEVLGKNVQELEKTIRVGESIIKEYGIILDNIGGGGGRGGHGGGGKKESQLSRTIRAEISLIRELRTEYDKLTKAGKSREDSLKIIQSRYSLSIQAINEILGKNKLSTLDGKKITKGSVKDITEYLKTLLGEIEEKGLKKKDPSVYNQVAKEIGRIATENEIFDINEFSKEIKNETDRLSQELKLFKELKNNPELRGFFDEIGFNAEKDINKIISDIKEQVKEGTGGVFENIFSDDIDQIAKDKGYDLSSNLIKTLKQVQQTLWQMFKDDLKEKAKNIKEYVENYGTEKEKMYLIDKHYNDLIRKETDPIKRKSLNNERDRKKSDIRVKELAMGINWDVALRDVGGVLQKLAVKALEDLDEFMGKDEFKKKTAEDKKQYYDLRNKLIQKSGTNTSNPFNLGIWSEISKQMKEWKDAVNKSKEAEKDLEGAIKDLTEAEKGGDPKEIDDAKAKVENAAKEAKKAKNKVTETENKLANTSEKATNGLQDFTNNLNEITDGSLYGLANGITKTISQLTKGTSKGLEATGETGAIIAAILQILDALGSHSKEMIDEMIDKLIGALEDVLKHLGDIFAHLIEGVARLYVDMFDAMGHWVGLDLQQEFNHSNAKKINELTERLTKSNERLAKSIDYLTEMMGNEAGAKAVFLSEKAMEAQLQINKNKKDIWIAQMRYHGSHKSNEHYFRDEYFAQWEDDIKMALKAAGLAERSIKSWADVQTLTEKEIAAINVFAPQAIEYLRNVGEYDKSSFLDDWIAVAGEYERIEKQINENLTQTSFDSLRDSFLSALTDMEKGAEEFANDFQSMIFKSLVNKFLLGDEFKEWLTSLYTKWADKIKNGNPSDLGGFRQEVYEKYLELMSGRDKLADAIKYKGETGLDLSALQQGIQSITEETGGAIEAYLNGISAQVYLQNDKLEQLISLTQVNDGSNSEIIQIMRNNLESVNVIKNTILDCLSPSRAFRVEMIN